jgi:hypothetical protein
MAIAQRLVFVFVWKGAVHSNRRGCQLTQPLEGKVVVYGQAMTYLSLSNSWVTHSIPLFTLSSPFLAHLCAITFRMSYTEIVWNERCLIYTDKSFSTFFQKVIFIVFFYIWHCIVFVHITVGWDSSVGIATRYGLEGLGIEFRWGRVFPHPPRPTLGPSQPPIQWVTWFSRG